MAAALLRPLVNQRWFSGWRRPFRQNCYLQAECRRLVILLISSSLLTPHFAFSQVPGTDTAALRKQAQLLMEQGRIEDSLPLLQQALAANPHDIQINLLFARTLQLLGRIPEAIAAYRTILGIEPANQAAALGLSSAYRAIFNYKQAEIVLRGAMRAHPANAEPIVALGELEMQLQHYDSAIAVLKRAVALAPTSTAALRDLAICYQLTGKSELALNNFNGQYGISDAHLLMAASVVCMLPCVILFFAAQKYFVESVAMTGLKA